MKSNVHSLLQQHNLRYIETQLKFRTKLEYFEIQKKKKKLEYFAQPQPLVIYIMSQCTHTHINDKNKIKSRRHCKRKFKKLIYSIANFHMINPL